MSISYYKNQLITNLADSTKINYKAYYHNNILFGADVETGDTPTDYSTQYLTFVATSGGTFNFSGTTTANTISYSTDSGATWSTPAQVATINVSSGDVVMWKGEMTPTNKGIGTFSASTASFDVEGNIMSLLYGDSFKNQTSLSGKDSAFRNLFRNTKCVNTENLILPATTLANYCYDSMFKNCTSLTTAPQLPATTLVNSCYLWMFYGCTSLTTAPQLPATTLATYCYYQMFNGCTNLNYIKMLATDISASNCLSYWVSGVASSGTFVKSASMTSLPTGNSGIPNGWTVQDASS